MKKPIKLSFEEDEEDEDITLTKSSSKRVGNRTGERRIKQAEVKILVAEETKPLVSSGNYDVNSLKELKLQQKFTTEAVATTIAKPDEMVVDEIILNGEDAEALEKQQENPEELTKEEKLLIKHVEDKNKKKNSRLFMGDLNDDDSRKNIDMTQEFDNDWEREIMRRGGIGSNQQIFEVVNKSAIDNYSNELSEIMQLVNSTYLKLEEVVEKDLREKEQLKSELEICEKEIEAIRKEKSAFLEEQGISVSNNSNGGFGETKMVVDE